MGRSLAILASTSHRPKPEGIIPRQSGGRSGGSITGFTNLAMLSEKPMSANVPGRIQSSTSQAIWIIFPCMVAETTASRCRWISSRPVHPPRILRRNRNFEGLVTDRICGFLIRPRTTWVEIHRVYSLFASIPRRTSPMRANSAVHTQNSFSSFERLHVLPPPLPNTPRGQDSSTTLYEAEQSSRSLSSNQKDDVRTG